VILFGVGVLALGGEAFVLWSRTAEHRAALARFAGG
jgi:hypothetical protein